MRFLVNLAIFVVTVYGGGYLLIFGYFADPPIPNRWWLLAGCFAAELFLHFVKSAMNQGEAETA